ncbi:MAG: hypothetical protein ACK5LE_09855 [Alphaproteobacteria bacterium]
MTKLRLDDILEAISKESQNTAQSAAPTISSHASDSLQAQAETTSSLSKSLKKNLNSGDTAKIVHLNVVSAHHRPKSSVADDNMMLLNEKDDAKTTILSLEEAVQHTDDWADEMLQASEELTAKAKAMRMAPLYLEDIITDDDILILTEPSDRGITDEIHQAMGNWLQKTDNETIKKIIESALTDKLSK